MWFYLIRDLTFILKMCGSPTGQSAAQRTAVQRRTDQRSGGAERRSGAERSGAQRRRAAQRRNTKSKQHSRKTPKIKTKTKMFKLVWLREPLSQTSLNFCCLFVFPMCFYLLIIPSCGVQASLKIVVLFLLLSPCVCCLLIWSFYVVAKIVWTSLLYF